MREISSKRLSRRHHYLPQMYLRGFADDADLVWVFDRQSNSYLHQGVLNTAVKKDFYTVTGPDGQKNDSVEQMMGNMVEGPTKHIIDRLDKKNLTWEGEDRAILALFVALLKTRTLAFDRDQMESDEELFRWLAKANHSSPEAVEEHLQEYERETGTNMTDVSAQELFEMVRDDRYHLESPRQNRIKLMLDLSLKVAQLLFQLKWEIFAAPKGMSFVTCDNPFTVVPPPFFNTTRQGYGILTPGASTVVPLSSKTAIAFFGEGDGTRGAVIRKHFLRSTNIVVAANSERFVIARDEPLLRSIVRKGKLDQWKSGKRFKLNAPDPYSRSRSEPKE